MTYADQADRANDLVSAWDQLLHACHHHAYELTPMLGEARDLLSRVQAWELADAELSGDL